MELNESTVYWITRLDYFHGISWAIGILFSVASIIIFISSLFWWYEEHNSSRFNLKTCIRAWIFCIVLYIPIIGALFIPTTKEMCAIKVIPIIANNEEVQKLPNKVVGLANEWLEELSPKEK